MSKLSRREFIRSAGVVGAAVALKSGPLRFLGLGESSESFQSTDEVPRLLPTVCGMCDASCGVLAYVQNGRVLKIEGNYNHSHSQGKICARGSAGVQLLYSEQRLKYPMRKGADGKWERTPWQQAVGSIGETLKGIKERYGPEALAWLHHRRISSEWDRQFMRAYGSPNIFSSRGMAGAVVHKACLYTLGDVPIPDFANSRNILLFGHSPAESIFVRELTDLMEAKARGARLTVVDPRLSRTAAQAYEWLPIRPGTDGALLLAISNVLFSEKLYDELFARQYVSGIDEFKAMVADCTPGWASALTGIPADVIRRLARDLGAAKPACIVALGTPFSRGLLYANSLQTTRAALALNALLGNYDAPGGLVMPQPVTVTANMPATPPVLAKRVDGAGGSAFPLASALEGLPHMLPEIILTGKPYPIKALIVNGSNPVLSLPNRAKVTEALKKLELIVVIDVQGSETGELAHYLLPESTYLERYDPLAVSQYLLPEVALRQPVVRPLDDSRAAHEIIAAIGEAAGLGGYFPSIEAVLKEQLITTGVNLDTFQKSGVWRGRDTPIYGKRKFKTKSGRIELYLEEFKVLGFDPLPSYKPPAFQPSNGSLRLIHGRQAVHTGTATQNIGWLNYIGPENELWINADLADKLAIRRGDTIKVSTKTGEVRVAAKPTHGIHPDAVYLVHGFGHNTVMQRLSFAKGVSGNDLIGSVNEPISGAAALFETAVNIERLH